jgi:hypothetical protein
MSLDADADADTDAVKPFTIEKLKIMNIEIIDTTDLIESDDTRSVEYQYF